ncbi:Protein ECT2 [Takifugu flavidus]|uniref:Protein ECT2 n=1 Tax=Takifugu flavidus TaxID=433684 RepID=A0A5C6MQV5_9TELE|nr:Protein ECT2 [Takifugu flavidus]
MADSSILTLGTARSLLVDSSVCDSRIAETTKDHLFLGMAYEDGEDMLPKVETRVVLVGEVGRNGALLKALQDISVPCMATDNVEEFGDAENTDFETVFVLAEFDCPQYQYLYKRDNRIVGPPVVLQCAMKDEPLLFSCRPLYSTTMIHLSLCFTGFRDKEEMKNLVNLVHHMGGTIRKDFSTKLAVCMGTPILTPSWIYKSWDKREDIHFHADTEGFRSEFKVPPFQDCILSFLGFSHEEKANMEERTLKHGGSYLEVGDERCTHMVVEENSVKELPIFPSRKLFAVKQEWFWGSIQMDARAGESMYLYEKNDSPAMKKAVSLLSLTTPNSNRKRRRLKDTLAQLTKETEISPFPPPRKRPSAEHNLSVMSLLDISNTPETCKAISESSRPSKSSAPIVSKQSARWQVSKELYQTESNYVGILNTILQLFKFPLEKEGQVGGPILAQEEIKTIFGSIPDIYEVHTRIKSDLEDLLTDWSDERSVGNIILNYSKELVKAYPPFVNFFEMSKETITRCEKQKPRFHAFLKINQAKPDCGRQTLVELLIRPVQRLPSVALLLNDIKKHTSDDNPDKITLEKAIESLKEVMTHINEDKRKTEGQKQIFDVVYEVDGCPANLLSSHRSLVYRVETIALGDQPCDRGENVTLFLFNDCLEIARKRHKVINTFKSPMGQTRPPPSLKHIALMPLSQIRRVLDLQDTEECVNAFALVVRPPTEQENLLFSFQLTGEETVKSAWLRTLCRHVANTICRADAEDGGRGGAALLGRAAEVVVVRPVRLLTLTNLEQNPARTVETIADQEKLLSSAPSLSSTTGCEDTVDTFRSLRTPSPRTCSGSAVGLQLLDSLQVLSSCCLLWLAVQRDYQENLIQCTEPDSVQVSTKDMDSTLSKASRAIKKTSKKVTRAFSFTKTPKRAIQRAFMASCTPDEKGCENHAGSSSTLAMSRSASTFSLSDSTKSGAVVQRSNSLDHPPVRPRVPIALRVPCSPTQIPPPTPKTGPESCQGVLPTKCLQNQESQSVHNAPNSPVPPKPQSGQSSCQQTSTTSVDLPPLRTSKPSQPKSSHQLPSGGCHSRLLVYRNLQVDPHRGVKNSPQRETLL